MGTVSARSVYGRGHLFRGVAVLWRGVASRRKGHSHLTRGAWPSGEAGVVKWYLWGRGQLSSWRRCLMAISTTVTLSALSLLTASLASRLQAVSKRISTALRDSVASMHSSYKNSRNIHNTTITLTRGYCLRGGQVVGVVMRIEGRGHGARGVVATSMLSSYKKAMSHVMHGHCNTGRTDYSAHYINIL